jgi:hypothetical protein
MQVAYVTGAIAADDSILAFKNKSVAIEVAYRLRQSGYAVICVHENLVGSDVLNHQQWLKHDLAILARCDVCVVCDNWYDSRGSIEEIQFCLDHNIKLIRASIKDKLLILTDFVFSRPTEV